VLNSRVSGDVVWMSDQLKPGGFFEKDDLLLKIEQIDYELAIKSASAELAEAQFIFQEEQAQSKQAELNWTRMGRSEAPGALVLRKPQLAKASAMVESARASLLRAELDLKRTLIKAPYAGRVLEQYVDFGQFVSSNTELVKVFAIDRVEVRLPLSERQREQLVLPSFYRGDPIDKQQSIFPIRIQARIGGQRHEWTGVLNRVEGSVSLDTRQQYIVAVIEDPFERNNIGRPPLEIGQYIEAELLGKSNKDVFVIPRSAVHGENLVMLIDKDNRIQRRTITPLAEQDNVVIVREGLARGDRLCISYIPFGANNTLVNVASNSIRQEVHKGKSKKIIPAGNHK